jgi:hypothetical protein
LLRRSRGSFCASEDKTYFLVSANPHELLITSLAAYAHVFQRPLSHSRKTGTIRENNSLSSISILKISMEAYHHVPLRILLDEIGR